MAGAGLIVIKRRIKSVTNTRKITKAMGLVATSKLRKVRRVLDSNNRYYDSLEESATLLLNSVDRSECDDVLIKGNKSKNKLYIVMTSDSGLCGGYNGAVVSNAIESALQDRENSKIMIVGEKGRTYFRKTGFETVAEYVEIPDVPTSKEAEMIYNHALHLYEAGEVGEVYVVYTRFFSPVKQIVQQKKILPIEVDNHEADYTLLTEPSLEEMAGGLISLYVKASIHNYLLNAKASEHGSRMSAMDNATKNADDILDKLNVKYNRIRQSAITQEISEIVGGAEAQR